MKNVKILTILVFAGLMFCLAEVGQGAPIGTAFTYQGHLYDANYVADGQYDFAFKLYDANVGGNKVGTDVNIAEVDVIEGYFTVELDFGIGAFVGNARWLEIGVRPGELSDPNAYTVLSPRQEVTPTPYALYTDLAGDADTIDGYNAGNSSGQVAVSNGGWCSTLNADMVDGYHASSFMFPSQDYGRYGVSSNLYEGYYSLSSKYLGISSTATNSDRVDGYHAGNSSNQVAVSNGTVCSNLNADKIDGYHLSNLDARYVNEGQSSSISSAMIMNGNVTASDMQDGAALSEILDDDGPGSGLNADYLDGYSYSSFMFPSQDYGRYNVSSTLYEGTYSLSSKYLGISATAQSSYDLVLPHSDSASSGSYGLKVTHTATNSDAPALHGVHDVTDWYGVGVRGEGGYYGVQGYCTPTGNHTYTGVYGYCSGGSGTNRAVVGEAYDGNYNYAVRGSAYDGNYNYGVRGYAYGGTTSYGVYGTAGGATTNYAGYFSGNARVTGTLTKGGGSFMIDHPLDPENKYLYHSFVESPDMMNIYNGNAVLDDNGEAVIELPDWFEALNRDFRYQLTCIGGFAQVYVAEEISDNSFKIAGGTAGMKVSWQVTGIRHDAWAEANRIPVEEDKPEDDIGSYIHPAAFGLSEDKGVDYINNARADEAAKGEKGGEL